jgi:nicotinic acid phosphoribosyltransferase
MPQISSALLTDLYQLNINMMAAYLNHRLADTAVFELFVRRLPARRGFLMAAGLDQSLQFLETVAFTAEDIAAIRGLGRFFQGFLSYLAAFRFTGDVDALPEGTAFFPDEPIIRVKGPCRRRSSSKPGSPKSFVPRRQYCDRCRGIGTLGRRRSVRPRAVIFASITPALCHR